MAKVKTPLDIMDDLYSLAYMMTGTETRANKLVSCPYVRAERAASATALFTIFRDCYSEMYSSDIAFNFHAPCHTSKERHGRALRQRLADIKLSVLLSEICGFNYREISEITGMPVDKRFLLTGVNLS